MAAMEKLREQGWHLSEEGFNLLSDSGNITDVHRIIKKALDFDLKEIGSGEGDISQGNVVLQIQKLRNVAAPKSNEESRGAPRMLKLSLTDGQNHFQAVEIEHIPSLSLNTPPGTKLCMKKGVLPTSHGIILLKSSHIASVLGGKVASLIEKWELNRKLAVHSRVRPAEEGGPPPWIPFGKKIIKVTDQEKDFKALADKERASKENAEFEAQRKDAIAEAAKQGSKKVFGGGNKQLLDHSVQRIVDHGFSVDQAEYALRVNRNNVDRALKTLQRNDNRHNRDPGGPREIREPRGKRFEKKVEDGKPSSGRVSLFDFLEDKLPAQSDIPEGDTVQPSNDTYPRDRGNYDRFESRGTDQSTRGGRNPRGGRTSEAPPRQSEELKSNRRFNTSNYSNSGSSQQSRPPRFQTNQDQAGYHPQDNGFRGSGFHRGSANHNNHRNTYAQSRFESGTVNDSGDGTANGTSYNKNRQNQVANSTYNRNHVQAESNPGNRQGFNAPHSRQNQVQFDASRRGNAKDTFQPHAGEKNPRNRFDKPQSAPVNQFDEPKGASGYNGQKVAGQFNNQTFDFQTGGTWVWQPGDKCMAKYWEDNRYYNAEVTAVSQRTCVVMFKDFNNYEEVLQLDCIPITPEDRPIVQGFPRENRRQENRQPRYNQAHNHIGAGMEFRRGGGGGGGGGTGMRGYGKRRGQQRSAQPIYQPPAQRSNTSVVPNTPNNPPP